MNIQTEAELKADDRFLPETFFLGPVGCWGYVQDFKGVVRRNFSADVDGRIEDGVTILDEVLTYEDGEQDVRAWHIRQKSPGVYSAKAEGVIGEAIIKSTGPNELRWTYDMEIPVNGRKIRLSFEDVMIRSAPDLVLTATTMKKFGLVVGRLTVAYQRK